MYILILWCISAVTSSQLLRRLIVSGSISDISEHPFAVALLYCRGSNCAGFCSGSLISPSVVLTAGHCVFDESSAFHLPQPPVPLGKMFVQIGTELVGVDRVENAGYGLNRRYPLDNDLGLVFLNRCIDEVEFVRIASSGAVSPSVCTVVSTVGFGRQSSLPAEIAAYDGRMRGFHSVVHSNQTCREAYVEGEVEERRGSGSVFSEQSQFCFGGNSVAVVCHGDSGGPVTTTIGDTQVQLGVTSFSSSAFCGASPAFATRVKASWVRDQMEGVSCPGWSIEESFETWPMEENIFEKIVDPARCSPGHWQCVDSAECIEHLLVCDGRNDCQDDSDEDPEFCRVPHGHLPVMMDLGAGGDLQGGGELFTRLEAQFDQLLATKSEEVKFEHSSSQISIIGMLTRGAMHVNSRASKVRPVECSSPEFQTQTKSLLARTCLNPLRNLENRMMLEREVGMNSAETDPSEILKACRSVESCVSSATGNSTYADWFKTVEACEEALPAVYIPILIPKIGLLSFCDSLEDFLVKNASREAYANSFFQKYGSSCSADVLAKVGPTFTVPLTTSKSAAHIAAGAVPVILLLLIQCIIL